MDPQAAGALVDPRGNVIAFPNRSEGKHVSGPARCIGCDHRWAAVVPFEARLDPIECPGCGAMKGLMVMPYVPEPGTPVWRCECGNDLMYVLRDGLLCPNCGGKASLT